MASQDSVGTTLHSPAEAKPFLWQANHQITGSLATTRGPLDVLLGMGTSKRISAQMLRVEVIEI